MVTNAFGNALGSSIADGIGGPSQSELELQKREDARDAEMFRLFGETPAERNPHIYGVRLDIRFSATMRIASSSRKCCRMHASAMAWPCMPMCS